MRAVFGILSLLVVVAIVGLLAKKQLGSVTALPATPTGSEVTIPAVTPGATPQQQSQQVQQQVKQSVENAMQPARPMPDDK